jgi:hypothetical protein
MIRIVKSVHQVAVERVNILQSWEAIEDRLELFGERLGSIFDFSGVKLSIAG